MGDIMKLKEIRELGSRGVLFIFEFGDVLYLIKNKNKLFLCDTSEGHGEMTYIKKYLKINNLENIPLLIFNTHSDWDHYFGNSSFLHEDIISHKLCREKIVERMSYDLYLLNKDIEPKLPNITFTDKLTFSDCGIEFIYLPGHTNCSAICVDYVDKCAYVGDLLEVPIPILNDTNLEAYIKSLEYLKTLLPLTLISTHSKVVKQTLIDEHITYLQEVLSGKYLTYTENVMPIRHNYNIKNLYLLKYDELIKERLKKKFDFKKHRLSLWNYIVHKHQFSQQKIWDLSNLSLLELINDIEEYDKIFMSDEYGMG